MLVSFEYSIFNLWEYDLSKKFGFFMYCSSHTLNYFSSHNFTSNSDNHNIVIEESKVKSFMTMELVNFNDRHFGEE